MADRAEVGAMGRLSVKVKEIVAELEEEVLVAQLTLMFVDKAEEHRL